MSIVFGRGASGVGDPEMNDSERRHADGIKFGRVHDADYAKAMVRVLIGDEDDEDGHLVTGWLPMAGGRAGGDSDWHPLEVGEDVMVLSESGELQNGMVMPAARYSTDNPAPGSKAGLWRKTFKDGGVLEYDRDSGELAFTAMQKATITVGGASITITDDSITISAGGDSLVIGGGLKHNGVNVGATHKHGGIQPGSGISAVPQ